MKSINYYSLAIIILILFSTSCKKEDEETDNPTNNAPNIFEVFVSPEENSAVISWTEAVDPDGDEVNYSLILTVDTVSVGDTLLVDCPELIHTVSDLEYETMYSGFVVAKDTKGKKTTVEFSFETGIYPNVSPLEFSLYNPPNGSGDITGPITFTWDDATDPDNDLVSYELLLDQSTAPSTSIVTELNATSYSYSGENLIQGQTYYWQVIARDGNGGEVSSTIFSFTIQTTMNLATDEPGWEARYAHTSVSFQDKLWVICGESPGGTHYHDVWSSTDGFSWVEDVADTPWGGKSRHAAVVFDDKIWVTGGKSFSNSGISSDVWYSEDGVTWIEATSDGGFGARYEHDMLVYNGKMWILGGRDFDNTAEISQSVWSSIDGINWAMETNTNFTYNVAGRALVNDNKMWYLGGFSNQVSWSTDGINWTNITDTPLGERIYPSVTAHDGKMWLLSGSDNLISQYFEVPDIWSSVDGINWELISSNAGFDGVAFGQAVSHNGKLWLIGGGGGFQSNFVTNDVWFFE